MVCPELRRDEQSSIPGFEANIVLDEDILEVGGACGGHVALRNLSRDVIEFQSDQPLVSYVVEPVTLSVVGGFSGWVAGTGISVRLEPGGVLNIPLLIGTTHTENGVTSPLPAGKYLIVADLPIYAINAQSSDFDRGVLPVSPFELQIVEKRS